MNFISCAIVLVSLINLYQCAGIALGTTNDALSRQRRSDDVLVGGEQEKDANNPEYLKLAEESMAKYLLEAKIGEEHLIKKVEKVTTQVVEGTLTNIYYVIEPKNCDGSCKKAKKCHSKVWEKLWENFKEITVSCEEVAPKSKRQIPGGEKEEDVNDPEFKTLAEESLAKYKQSSGSKSSLRITKINKVTSQVVSGSLTKIEFEVAAGSEEQYVCTSEIHEQPWMKTKDINVTCTPKSG